MSPGIGFPIDSAAWKSRSPINLRRRLRTRKFKLRWKNDKLVSATVTGRDFSSPPQCKIFYYSAPHSARYNISEYRSSGSPSILRAQSHTSDRVSLKPNSNPTRVQAEYANTLSVTESLGGNLQVGQELYLGERLGNGNFAVVHKCFQYPKQQTLVGAVKVLKADAADGHKREFKKEWDFAKVLHKATGVVQTFAKVSKDATQQGGYVMELLGGALEGHKQPFTYAKTLIFLDEMLGTLRMLHTQYKVIHADIHVGNVLVSGDIHKTILPNEAERLFRLADFGMSIHLGDSFRVEESRGHYRGNKKTMPWRFLNNRYGRHWFIDDVESLFLTAIQMFLTGRRFVTRVPRPFKKDKKNILGDDEYDQMEGNDTMDTDINDDNSGGEKHNPEANATHLCKGWTDESFETLCTKLFTHLYETENKYKFDAHKREDPQAMPISYNRYRLWIRTELLGIMENDNSLSQKEYEHEIAAIEHFKDDDSKENEARDFPEMDFSHKKTVWLKEE